MVDVTDELMENITTTTIAGKYLYAKSESEWADKKRGELVDGCVERVGELVLEIGKWIEYLV